MILIVSLVSSFEINKVNLFRVLTAPFPLIFRSNLLIAFEVKLPTNPGKLSLAKEIAIFVSAFLPKLPKQEPKDLPDWIILGIWALLSLISVDILLAKAFFILVVCRVVGKSSCGNSSSSKFLSVNVNNVPVLFFVADFSLFNCGFVSLLLASW